MVHPLLASALSDAAVTALLALATNPVTYGVIVSVVWLAWAQKQSFAGTVRDAAEIAFHIVEDLKAQGKLPPGADKVVVAMEHFESVLTNQNITLTDELRAGAILLWSALHGEQKVAQAQGVKS